MWADDLRVISLAILIGGTALTAFLLWPTVRCARSITLSEAGIAAKAYIGSEYLGWGEFAEIEWRQRFDGGRILVLRSADRQRQIRASDWFSDFDHFVGEVEAHLARRGARQELSLPRE